MTDDARETPDLSPSLASGSPAPETPVCHICGKPATCIGAYEGGTEAQSACDDCCGHGNEDGWCVPIAEWNQCQSKQRH